MPRTLAQIFEGLDADFVGVEATLSVDHVVADSRKAGPGVAFLALRGERVDGHDFVQKAIELGAPVVIVERGAGFEGPCVQVPDTQVAHGIIAANFFGWPARAMTSLGVTGTNGKTTVAHLVSACFDAAQVPHARLGTTGNWVVDRELPTQFTTPFPLQLQSLLAQTRDAGAQALVMEVSSHALAQGRVDPISFSAVAMTSFSQDHLDFHATMRDYLDAKLRLASAHLDADGLALAAVDHNPSAHEFLDAAATRGAETWALSRADARVADDTPRGHVLAHARNLALHAGGTRFDFVTPRGELKLQSPLVGAFNVDNLMVAAALALHAGVPVAAIERGLAQSGGAPGRLERVGIEGSLAGGPVVYVDYAHTPDAVARTLAVLRPHTTGKLRIVLGCGGDRDAGKRPLMGRAASQGADVFYATSDNPRTEDPVAIVDDMVAGALAQEAGGAERFTIVDRAQAIARAIADAAPDDTVLIAGKGHEDYQILGTDKIDFDDREHARAALAARG